MASKELKLELKASTGFSQFYEAPCSRLELKVECPKRLKAQKRGLAPALNLDSTVWKKNSPQIVKNELPNEIYRCHHLPLFKANALFYSISETETGTKSREKLNCNQILGLGSEQNCRRAFISRPWSANTVRDKNRFRDANRSARFKPRGEPVL